MGDADWVKGWPDKLTRRCRHLADMIKSTRSEKSALPIAKIRTDLTDVLSEYDDGSAESVIKWVKSVLDRLKETEKFLTEVCDAVDSEKIKMIRARDYAHSLIAWITSTIRLLEKALNERE